MKFTSIVGVIIAAVAITFAFQNNDTVTLQFFSWTFTESVALLIIAALLTGFVVGMILFLPGNMTATWRAQALQKENDALTKTLKEEAMQYESEGLGKEGDQVFDL